MKTGGRTSKAVPSHGRMSHVCRRAPAQRPKVAVAHCCSRRQSQNQNVFFCFLPPTGDSATGRQISEKPDQILLSKPFPVTFRGQCIFASSLSDSEMPESEAVASPNSIAELYPLSRRGLQVIVRCIELCSQPYLLRHPGIRARLRADDLLTVRP